MTPKEDAIELFKKNLEWISNTYYHVGTYSKSEEDKSKECAEIAFKKVIEELKEFDNEDGYSRSRINHFEKAILELKKL
jgi:hypothetical protein